MIVQRILLTILLVFVTCSGLTAQNAKTHQLMKKADHLFMRRHTFEAEKLYRDVLKVDPNNYQAITRVARCNWYLGNLEECVKWYEAAIQANPTANDTVYFDYGLALKREERYPEAKQAFQTFIKQYPLNDHFKKQAEVELKGCDFAIAAKNEEPKYVISTLNLNSSSGDFSPIIYSVKGDSFMIFSSHRSEALGKAKFLENGEDKFSDLFIAKFTSDSTFDKIETMGKKINTKANDGNGAVSPDGKTLYYTICGKGKVKKHHGCSIYSSEYNPEAKTWGKSQLVEGINGTKEVVKNSRGKTKKVPTWDAQPALSADGNTMYFSSDREGGEGDADIWYSTKIGNAWGTPVNCGKSINTPFHEFHPHIAKDGKTLYFASDGHLSFGGYDIFKAEGNQANWAKPENLGYGINSADDDFAMYWEIGRASCRERV